MPAALTAGLPLPGAPSSHQPEIISIPGTSTAHTSRRSATNPLARLSAYVVRDKSLDDSPHSALTVAIKSNGRYLGISLKGHAATIVDLEFLATPADAPVHVLGSCDVDGIVYLWFLYVEKDALHVDSALKLLRKYSFYSLRRSRSAYYSRIRLNGTSENGTMVLVPNDGSNVRVVTFHCEPNTDVNGKPNMPVIEPPPKAPQLPAPEPKEFEEAEDIIEEEIKKDEYAEEITERKIEPEEVQYERKEETQVEDITHEEEDYVEPKATERQMETPTLAPPTAQREEDEGFVDARGEAMLPPDPPTQMPPPPRAMAFVEDTPDIDEDYEDERVAEGGAQAVNFVEEEELESDIEDTDEEEYTEDEEEAEFEARANGQVAGF